MKVMKWSAALFCGMALAIPVAAQEEEVPKEPAPAQTESPAAPAEAKARKTDVGDPPLHKWGGWTISVAGWDPALGGADEEVATTFQNGIGTPLIQESSGRMKETVEVAYHLPHGAGSVVVQYNSMSDDATMQKFTPGFFNFAETRAFPAFLGAFDDGFADGVRSSTLRKTRELRLEYQRQAFETKWAKGTWGAGYRRVDHSRALGISYEAIAPNFPPVIPPTVPEGTDPLIFAPLADSVSQSAAYNGHGLGASFKVEFPVHPRVSIISGLAIGLIRGEAASQYLSSTSYFFLVTPDNPITTEQLFQLIAGTLIDPSDDTPYPISAGGQDVLRLGSRTDGTSQMAQTYDVFVGFEARVWKGLRVFGMLREMYYANVGEYVVLKPGPEMSRTQLSAGYEGYAVGLSWKF